MDDKHISMVHESGVALATIQSRNQKVRAKAARIRKLEQRIEKLEQLIRLSSDDIVKRVREP
jgi:hypothetical protein